MNERCWRAEGSQGLAHIGDSTNCSPVEQQTLRKGIPVEEISNSWASGLMWGNKRKELEMVEEVRQAGSY